MIFSFEKIFYATAISNSIIILSTTLILGAQYLGRQN